MGAVAGLLLSEPHPRPHRPPTAGLPAPRGGHLSPSRPGLGAPSFSSPAHGLLTTSPSGGSLIVPTGDRHPWALSPAGLRTQHGGRVAEGTCRVPRPGLPALSLAVNDDNRNWEGQKNEAFHNACFTEKTRGVCFTYWLTE